MRFILLSDKFYQSYGKYREILQKDGRPYACLEVEIDGIRFAIPFRHHIPHKYAFFTYDTCGLDYTKAVVIKDESMISSEIPTIEQKEFNFLKGKDSRVESGMRQYYKLLKNALRYRDNPRYANILRFSALKYFIS